MFRNSSIYLDLIKNLTQIDAELNGKLDCSFIGGEFDTLLALIKYEYYNKNWNFTLGLFVFLIFGAVYTGTLVPVVLRYRDKYDFSQYTSVVNSIN